MNSIIFSISVISFVISLIAVWWQGKTSGNHRELIDKLSALRFRALHDDGAPRTMETDLIWALLNINRADSLSDTLSALIECGADVNARDTRGIPAISLVMQSGIKDKYSILEKMHKAGVDVNAMTPNGNTVLFGIEDTKIIGQLIEYGAIIDAQNAEGKTPLHVARSVDVLMCLLNHGANPNICDNLGRTPLFYAKDKDYVFALLRAGADVNIVDNEGNRPTILQEFKELPVFEPKPEHYDDSLNELLFMAVRDKYLSRARELLQKGANLEKACGYAPLINISESAEMHQLLCSYGADPNQVVKNGNTPIINAIVRRKPELCRVLLRYGAKVSGKDLNCCIGCNVLECCRVLLESGVIVEFHSWDYAVSCGYADIIELLEEYSDFFRLSFEDAPTLELKMRIARKNGQKLSDGDKTKLLKQLYTDSNRNDNLAKAVEKGDIEGVRLLLGQGANPNYHTEFDTMLTEACSDSQSEIVELLCAAGADVNGKNQFGVDPWSRSEHSPKCREILKKYGVKPRLF